MSSLFDTLLFSSFQKTRMDCVVKILCAIILATLTDISLGSLISQKHFIPSPALHPSPKSNQTCPCNQDQLCLPLAQAKEKYPSAPHVQEYIKKSSKKEVGIYQFYLKLWWKFRRHPWVCRSISSDQPGLHTYWFSNKSKQNSTSYILAR